MKRVHLTDIDTVISIFYTKSELTTQDIMSLFECSKNTAQKLKREAQDWQEKQGAIRHSAVNPKTAFEVWGIDIADIERRFMKKQKLKEKGMII